MTDTRRHGDASRRQSVLALPPTRDELAFEASQAFKIIKASQSPRRQVERARSYAMFNRDVICSVGSQRRGPQSRQHGAFFFQMLEGLDDQQRRRALRRVWIADHIFQIPTLPCRYGTGC